MLLSSPVFLTFELSTWNRQEITQSGALSWPLLSEMGTEQSTCKLFKRVFIFSLFVTYLSSSVFLYADIFY